MRKLLFACVGLAFVGCEFKLTTATIKNSKVCSEALFEEGKGCIENVEVFEEFPSIIYNSMELKNAPKGTEVRIYWFQLVEDKYALIDSVTYESSEANELLNSTVNGNSFPIGQYKVVARVVANNQQPIEKKFEIKFPKLPAANLSFIGRSIYEDKKVNEITNVFNQSDSTVYFSTSLYNVPFHSDVHIHFEGADGVQHTFSLNTAEISNEKININANIKRSALGIGECKVILEFLDLAYTYPFVVE